MMDWQMLMAIGGGIVLLGNVASVLWKIISPGIKLKDTVGKNKEGFRRNLQHEQNAMHSNDADVESHDRRKSR